MRKFITERTLSAVVKGVLFQARWIPLSVSVGSDHSQDLLWGVGTLARTLFNVSGVGGARAQGTFL